MCVCVCVCVVKIETNFPHSSEFFLEKTFENPAKKAITKVYQKINLLFEKRTYLTFKYQTCRTFSELNMKRRSAKIHRNFISCVCYILGTDIYIKMQSLFEYLTHLNFERTTLS